MCRCVSVRPSVRSFVMLKYPPYVQLNEKKKIQFNQKFRQLFDKSSHIWLHLDYRLNRVVLKHLSRLMGGREEIAIAPLNWNSVLPTIKHLTLKGNNSIHSLSLNAFCSCFKCSCFCCDVNYFHHTIWKLARIYWSARNFPL